MRNAQMAIRPKLAMCNIFSDVYKMRQFALDYGFSGIDWSFDVRRLPGTPAQESEWVKDVSALGSLEVRYHCPFYRMDLGHHDPREAAAAEAIFHRIIRLVSKVQGRYLTIHIGLGHDSTQPLSWEETIDNLGRLVRYGANRGVRICLENLAWGWTSRPHLFEKLVRRSGADVTFDIGHAHACESVNSHHHGFEDFVTPHADRVFNAHVYHTEVSGLGHIPPDRIEDTEDRLSILQEIGCEWWVIEIKKPDGLLETKRIIEEHLASRTHHSKTDGKTSAPNLMSHGQTYSIPDVIR